MWGGLSIKAARRVVIESDLRPNVASSHIFRFHLTTWGRLAGLPISRTSLATRALGFLAFTMARCINSLSTTEHAHPTWQTIWVCGLGGWGDSDGASVTGEAVPS